MDELPEQFVLKCNHDSGSVCICKNKSTFDFEKAKKKLNRAMKRNYFWLGREWVYKRIEPCIFAEKYMVDESHEELKDYKVFCFGGKPIFVQVDYSRFTSHHRNCYDLDWNLMDMSFAYPMNPEVKIKRPKKLDEMIGLAEKLSEGTNFLRVDFYSVEDKLYFGEFTFYPGSGIEVFTPKEWNVRFGELIHINSKK